MMSTAEQSFTFETAPYPYPGLRSFRQDEYSVFFGRSEHVETIEDKLLKNKFLAVVGPSGCGKSSLVRAGLIPKLKFVFQDEFEFAVCRPGKHPLKNIADALCSAAGKPDDSEYLQALLRQDPHAIFSYLSGVGGLDKNYLIVIDQFEEIFRYKDVVGSDEKKLDESEARKFVKRILKCVEHRSNGKFSIHLLLTMRSDFLGSCAEFERLAEEISESQFLTPRMTRGQLKEAIVGPTQVFGFGIDPFVVNRILNEIGNDPDQLPVMQHLLMRLWRNARIQKDLGDFESVREESIARSEGVRIEEEDYEAVGGIRDALKNHGSNVLIHRFSKKERSIAEYVLKAITTIDIEGRAVRNPKTVNEILAFVCSRFDKPKHSFEKVQRKELYVVLNKLRSEGRTFIFPHIDQVPKGKLTGDIPIDITHEGLIRKWDMLNEWIFAEYDRQKNEGEIHKQARIWEENDRPSSHLLNGVELEAARKWVDQEFGLRKRDLSIQQSLKERRQDFQKVPEEIRDFLLESERSGELITTSEKLNHRIFIGSWFLAAMAIFAVGAFGFAIYEVQAAATARSDRQNAETEKARLDEELRLAQEAKSNALKEKALAEVAVRAALDQKNAAQAAKLEAEELRAAAEAETLVMTEAKERAVLDNLLNQVKSDDSYFYPISTVRLLNSFHSLSKEDRGARKFQSFFDVSSRALLDWFSRNFDLSVRSEIITQSSQDFSWCAASSDSKFVACAGLDRLVHLWNAKTKKTTVLSGHTDKIYQLAFSPDNQWMASCGADKLVIVWDLNASEPQEHFRFQGKERIYSVAIDDQFVAAGDGTGTIYVGKIPSRAEDRSKVADIESKTIGAKRVFKCEFARRDGKTILFALELDGKLDAFDVRTIDGSTSLTRVEMSPPRQVRISSRFEGYTKASRDSFFIVNDENGEVESIHVADKRVRKRKLFHYIIYRYEEVKKEAARKQRSVKRLVPNLGYKFSGMLVDSPRFKDIWDVDFGFIRVPQASSEFVLAGARRNRLELLDLRETGDSRNDIDNSIALRMGVSQLEFIDTKRFVASAENEVFLGEVFLGEVAEGRQRRVRRGKRARIELSFLGRLEGSVRRLTVLKDAKSESESGYLAEFVTVDGSGAARIWRVTDRESLVEINKRKNFYVFESSEPKQGIRFNERVFYPSDAKPPLETKKNLEQSGRYLASAVWENEEGLKWGLATQYSGFFTLFDLTKSKRQVDNIPRVALYRPCQKLARAVAFSPDGNFFAIGSDNGIVQIYETPPHEKNSPILLKQFSTGLPSAVLSLAFSEDSQWVAMGTEDGKLLIGEVVSLGTSDERSFLIENARADKGIKFVTFHEVPTVLKAAGNFGKLLIASDGEDTSLFAMKDQIPVSNDEVLSISLPKFVSTTWPGRKRGTEFLMSISGQLQEYIEKAFAYYPEMEFYEDQRGSKFVGLLGRNLGMEEIKRFDQLAGQSGAMSGSAFPSLTATPDQLEQALLLVTARLNDSNEVQNGERESLVFQGVKELDSWLETNDVESTSWRMLQFFAKVKAVDELWSDSYLDLYKSNFGRKIVAEVEKYASSFKAALREFSQVGPSNNDEKDLFSKAHITDFAVDALVASVAKKETRRAFNFKLWEYLVQGNDARLSEIVDLLETGFSIEDVEWAQSIILGTAYSAFNVVDDIPDSVSNDVESFERVVGRINEIGAIEKIQLPDLLKRVESRLGEEFANNLSDIEELLRLPMDGRSDADSFRVLEPKLNRLLTALSAINNKNIFVRAHDKLPKLSWKELGDANKSERLMRSYLANTDDWEGGRRSPSNGNLVSFLSGHGLEAQDFKYPFFTNVSLAKLDYDYQSIGFGYKFNELFGHESSSFQPRDLEQAGRQEKIQNYLRVNTYDLLKTEVASEQESASIRREIQRRWNAIGAFATARQMNNISWYGSLNLQDPPRNAGWYYQISRQSVNNALLSYAYRDTLAVTMLLSLEYLDQRMESDTGENSEFFFLEKQLASEQARKEFLKLARAQLVYFCKRSDDPDHIQSRLDWVHKIDEALNKVSQPERAQVLRGMIDLEMLRNE